ncbi:MAG TPA: hypothetical protein DHU89_05450 [Flavobacteriales bacterium]|nr:hypothetical protein [Flavobacteriales bacterium]|tara:strand:+ start:9409 stop:9930 length:522 start_codon:yes stop_codon:yes gene_type:complete
MKLMIKPIIIAIAICFTSAGIAQNNAIDKYYSDYADDERFTKVSISSKMFSLFTNFSTEDANEQQVIETIGKLKGLKILIGDGIIDSKQIYKAVNSTAAVSYEELMTVENAEQEMIFYISESGGTITELVMLMYEGESIMILSLTGDIDLQELSNLSDKMDIQGFEEFKNLKK